MIGTCSRRGAPGIRPDHGEKGPDLRAEAGPAPARGCAKTPKTRIASPPNGSFWPRIGPRSPLSRQYRPGFGGGVPPPRLFAQPGEWSGSRLVSLAYDGFSGVQKMSAAYAPMAIRRIAPSLSIWMGLATSTTLAVRSSIDPPRRSMAWDWVIQPGRSEGAMSQTIGITFLDAPSAMPSSCCTNEDSQARILARNMTHRLLSKLRLISLPQSSPGLRETDAINTVTPRVSRTHCNGLRQLEVFIRIAYEAVWHLVSCRRSSRDLGCLSRRSLSRIRFQVWPW